MMSTGTQMAEADWSEPATKGELMLVQSDLNGKIDRVAADLNGKIDRVAADLNGKIDRVAAELNGKIDRLDSKIDVGLKSLELGISQKIWVAAGALTAVGVLLRLW